MKIIIRLVYISLLFFFISTITYPANHYVNKNAFGANNGTSWNDAWESFSAINWSSLSAGDTLFISGGTDSLYYYETMTVAASGTLNNNIVITPGRDSGHNGKVIIDGQNVRANGIIISAANTAGYVKVFGDHRLSIKGSNDIQISIFVGAASRHLDYVTIEACSLLLSFAGDGEIKISGSTGTYKCRHILIRDNDFISRSECRACDRLVFIRTEDVWVDGNRFIGQNYAAGDCGFCHDDCIQTYFGSKNFIISNNYFYDGDTSSSHQINMLEDTDGINVVYNNVYYMPNKIGYGNTFLDKGDGLSPLKYIVINNTVISGSNRNQFDTNADTIIAYNNVFHCTGTLSGGAGIGFNNAGDWTKIQANHFGQRMPSGWNDLSLTTLNGYGAETFGNSATRWRTDPLLVNGTDGDEFPNEDFRPTENSLLRNAGIDVRTLIESIGWAEVGDYLQWVDIEGNPRDSSPSLGAYEYEDGPDLTPPTVIGATLLDSVTLVVSFSEALDQTTAEDENNYSITNNINIFNASLSGSKVTLQTSVHSPGSYVVTVINVEDLAGNPIAPPSNTAEYEYVVLPPDTLVMLPVQNVEGVIIEPDHTPEKTIDGLGALNGDPDSRWAAEPMPEELIFDLGTNRTVCKTKLSFYNWNAGRVYTYSISISSDHNNWTTIIPQATSASNEEWTIDEFSPVDARYILVHFINNNQTNWAGLWEGEIWGLDLITSANDGLPNEFLLYQNYPNPFNPSTIIKFSVSQESNINLSIYNVLGELIATLVNEQLKPGYYEYEFNAEQFSSGVYLYKINAGEFVKTKKMVLMK